MMNIQSLSIVVPNKKCANNCPFCVSRMVNSNIYPNLMDINDPHYDINVREYMKRMKHVADLGCTTAILTGTSEPQQNKQFLSTFALLHQQIGSPFANLEMQCTGLFLNGNRDYLRFLRNFVGVNTIALSVNSLDDKENNELLGHGLPDKEVKLEELCSLLKEYDFNIRICLNMSSYFDWAHSTIDELCMHNCAAENMLYFCSNNLHANQVTLRKLYSNRSGTPQSQWIKDHQLSKEAQNEIEAVLSTSPKIGKTKYGSDIYEFDGMSVVYDTDCMGKEHAPDSLKYLILRPNCKLYSSWESTSSLVF